MVKVFIKGDNLPKPEVLHQHRMVGIGRGKVVLNIQIKQLAQSSLPKSVTAGNGITGRTVPRIISFGHPIAQYGLRSLRLKRATTVRTCFWRELTTHEFSSRRSLAGKTYCAFHG